jgi:hypothetical protein
MKCMPGKRSVGNTGQFGVDGCPDVNFLCGIYVGEEAGTVLAQALRRKLTDAVVGIMWQGSSS